MRSQLRAEMASKPLVRGPLLAREIRGLLAELQEWRHEEAWRRAMVLRRIRAGEEIPDFILRLMADVQAELARVSAEIRELRLLAWDLLDTAYPEEITTTGEAAA